MNTANRIFNSPSVSEGRVHFVAGGNLYGLDTKTGEEAWKLSKGRFISFHAVNGDILYAGNTETGLFYALNASTGEEKWTFDPNPSYIPVFSDDLVFISTTSNELISINKETGEEEWRLQFDGRTVLSQSADDLIFTLSDGELFMINIYTGEITGNMQFDVVAFWGQPVIYDKKVYIPGRETLYVVH